MDQPAVEKVEAEKRVVRDGSGRAGGQEQDEGVQQAVQPVRVG